jgi:MFS family permease
LAAPLGGELADVLGRRPTLVTSLVTGALAMICMGFAHSPLSIGSAAFALGLFGEMYRPAMSAAIADVVDVVDRPRAFGLVYWAVNLGFSLASVLAGMFSAVSFGVVFGLDAATTIAFGAIVAWRVPETRPRSAPALGAPTKPRFAYSDGVFMAFVLASFAVGTVFCQGFAPLPLDMASHGVTAREFGYLLAINGVMVVFLQPLAVARLSKQKRPERALALGAVLIGIGYGACAFARSPLAYAATVVIWTLGEIAMAPIGPALAADLAPADRRGAYQGAYQLSGGGSTFVAPLVGSLLLGRFGSVGLWSACFVVALVAAGSYLALGPFIARRLAR